MLVLTTVPTMSFRKCDVLKHRRSIVQRRREARLPHDRARIIMRAGGALVKPIRPMPALPEHGERRQCWRAGLHEARIA